MRYLIFGGGWIGHRLLSLLPYSAISYSDILDANAVMDDIERHQPSFVINAAGVTGKPNIDWCEATVANAKRTNRSNVAGPAVLAFCCQQMGADMIHISSGCLWGDGENRTEKEAPNPVSFYSVTKWMGEDAIMQIDKAALILRIRMPIDYIAHQRNLLTKLPQYKTVLSSPQSVTSLATLAYSISALAGSKSGIFHVVDDHPITGREIIEAYKEIIDRDHRCEFVTPKEFASKGLAATGRSNCTLSNDKLKQFVIVRDSRELVRDYYKQMAMELQNGQGQ